MSFVPAAILNAGLVTSVGLSAPSACAAIRGAITNHTPTRFMDADGEWIMGAQVTLEKSWQGRKKLIEMVRTAVEECIAPIRDEDLSAVPLLLCVAEEQRPGRLRHLDHRLLAELQRALSIEFHKKHSTVIPEGRVGAMTALVHARKLLRDQSCSYVVIAATDSLLVAPSLAGFEAQGRLLTARNSNGFIPGEAAGAILIGPHVRKDPCVLCHGVGRAQELATIFSDGPLRAEGLGKAITLALEEAHCEMHDLDFRITDNSGEHYYFKEAALALSRTLRKRKEEFDMWHPADCIGEVGATAGVAALIVAWMAYTKAYAPGKRCLIHSGSDAGDRGAAVLSYQDDSDGE